jgi:valyl-tRNA synthetase
MSQLSKQYTPRDVEEKWYKRWEENKFFHAEPNAKKKPYTVMIPPPNVTGSLTMGHVLNNSIQDVFVRWKRMCGCETLWMPGTDHAGIATQNVVEKSLAKEGMKRKDLGREKFLEHVWKWKEQYGGTIIKQLRKLGCSCDWERERFTMDEGLSEAVQEIFVRLYEKGLIYRGKYIVNWCPKDHTALSDDEVNNTEQQGNIWYLQYPVKEQGAGSGEQREYITVATTRPETMLGDTAVAVHPKDERYVHLHGKHILLPLVNREIPIVVDDYVDPTFGSGAVKITPAHDANDFWVGERHKLPQINVFDESARLNENAPQKYQGLDRYECRKIILEDLQAGNFLVKTEEYKNTIGRCYRCDSVIEPYLSNQWFVKMKPLAEKALQVVKDGTIKFHPERWEKVYEHWMTNIRDWCISRQLWWGHRIPVWYCVGDDHCTLNCKAPIVSKTKPENCKHCNSQMVQDEDVLDTWFSSWLWPFSTLGWPKENNELKYFYPSDTLVTGPDIIFFWVARMIMAGLEVMNVVPFRDVYFTSIIRDSQGRKMSKSLGNSPDPLNVIDEYGADALRFTILFLAPLGQDVRFAAEKCEIGRNFANKIWNAGRFLLMNQQQVMSSELRVTNLENEQLATRNLQLETHLDLADKWILSRLHSTIKDLSNALEHFEINQATKILYDFIWHDYCDWYVEMLKSRLYGNESNEIKRIVLQRAMYVFETSLRLLHPFMPFVTEELWQNFSMDHGAWSEEQGANTHRTSHIANRSIMVAEFPKANEKFIDNQIEKDAWFMMEVVNAVRNIRGELNVPPSTEVNVMFRFINAERNSQVTTFEPYLKRLGKVGTIEFISNEYKPKFSSSAIVDGEEFFIPLEGIIDMEKERERIEKEIARMQSLYESTSKKLENESFVSRAPKDVIEKEREKLTTFQQTVEKLKVSFENLK